MKRITTAIDKKIKSLYKSELSAAEIALKLFLSINQVYRSLKRQNIERRGAKLQNEIRFRNKPLSYNMISKPNLKQKQLLASAVMLYMGEGAKNGSTVDFTNSNPALLKIFISFLRDICQVQKNRIRLYLYCFSNQDSNFLISFWSKELKVSKKQFTKPHVRKLNTKGARIMPYGVLHIRYSDKKLLNQILSMSEQIIALLTE